MRFSIAARALSKQLKQRLRFDLPYVGIPSLTFDLLFQELFTLKHFDGGLFRQTSK